MQGLSVRVGLTSGRLRNDIVIQVQVRLGEIQNSKFCRIGAATLNLNNSASFKATEA